MNAFRNKYRVKFDSDGVTHPDPSVIPVLSAATKNDVINFRTMDLFEKHADGEKLNRDTFYFNGRRRLTNDRSRPNGRRRLPDWKPSHDIPRRFDDHLHPRRPRH